MSDREAGFGAGGHSALPPSLSMLCGTGRIVIITAPTDGGILREPSGRWHSGEGELPVVTVDVETLLEDEAELRAVLDASTASDADTVLLFPPFGHKRRNMRRDSSEIATANIARCLGSSTRLVTLLLQATIARNRENSLLAEVAEERPVAAVIGLPLGNLFVGIQTSMQACAVVFDPTPVPKVVFLKTPRVGEILDFAEQYDQLKSGRSTTDDGFLLDGPINVAAGFTPAQLDPVRLERIAEAEAIGELTPLGELCELLHGPKSMRRPQRGDANPNSGEVPVISARVIRGSGIAIDEITEWASPEEGLALEPGDLLLRQIGHADQPVAVAEVHESDLPAIAGGHILVLRPLANLTPPVRRVLRHFIASNRFKTQLMSMSHIGGSVRLTIRELRDVVVPVPDDDLLDAFAAVETAAEEFAVWRAEATELMKTALDGDDLVAARNQLITNTNLLRQRAEAARSLDDFSHRVATRFPLPLAYRWRTALAAQGQPDALQTMLKAQEVLLAYLAIVAVLAAQVGGIELGQIKDIRLRLSNKRGGLTLGDWRSLLDEVANAKAIRRLPETHPFIEVRGFFADPTVLAASADLAAVRNDASHLREFGPGEQARAMEKAWNDLERLFLAAEFITDYPLIRILETRWDSLEQSNSIAYLRLAGDSPIVPRSHMTSTDHTIETDSLYLIDRTGGLHLLRPLLVGVTCPSCGHWSTFHPDRISEDGMVQYKSLERGHPTEMPDQKAGLVHAGFINQTEPPSST